MPVYKNIIGLDARFMLRPLRGIPLYVTRLCEYLPYNRDLFFVLFINKGFEHNDLPINYQKRIDHIVKLHENIIFVNCDDSAEAMWEQRYLPKLVKKYNVDLLHMPANRSCFFAGVPTVVTVHDTMEYLYLLNQKYPVRRKDPFKMILYNLRQRVYIVATYKFGIGKASRVVTVSENSARDLRDLLRAATEKVIVIHHGVDPDYLLMPPLPIHERTHTLMLGGDSHQKNAVAAVNAWALVSPEIRKKYPLKIIGFCGGDSSAIIQTLRKCGLKDEVEVQGWISHEMVVHHFRTAALFIFPSRYEGFGLPLIQAMASGTPVVSSNRSSVPEVLGGVGLKYDPDDTIGMAAGIELILLDTVFWKSQSSSGPLRAQAFTWENSAAAHLKVYQELLR